VFAVHFTHPDEFLAKDASGNYIKNGASYIWQPVVENAISELTKRHNFISLENQTPIIHKVNDNPQALFTLQKELYHHGVNSHYFFQCREIEGHRMFAVPVEETWRIFTESQRGLSGVERKARLAMSTEQGKMEIIGVTDGKIILRVMRSPGDAGTQGNIIIAHSNPEALWITGYKDRIISDDTGIFKDAE
jgi:L-lysine 2,3-aminomutase